MFIRLKWMKWDSCFIVYLSKWVTIRTEWISLYESIETKIYNQNALSWSSVELKPEFRIQFYWVRSSKIDVQKRELISLSACVESFSFVKHIKSLQKLTKSLKCVTLFICSDVHSYRRTPNQWDSFLCDVVHRTL